MNGPNIDELRDAVRLVPEREARQTAVTALQSLSHIFNARIDVSLPDGGPMRPLPFGVIVAFGLSSSAIAQGLPPLKKTEPANRQSISVRGCIRDQTLVETDGTFAPVGTTYRLRGSKAALANLKEHNGHEDELLGTTQIADDKKSRVTKEKKIGKGRVYGTASAAYDDGMALPEDPWVDVVSIKHVNARCPGK